MSRLDLHKGFDQKRLPSKTENEGSTNINFSTAYTMEQELNKQIDTKQFPIFLMVERKT